MGKGAVSGFSRTGVGGTGEKAEPAIEEGGDAEAELVGGRGTAGNGLLVMDEGILLGAIAGADDVATRGEDGNAGAELWAGGAGSAEENPGSAGILDTSGNLSSIALPPLLAAVDEAGAFDEAAAGTAAIGGGELFVAYEYPAAKTHTAAVETSVLASIFICYPL